MSETVMYLGICYGGRFLIISVKEGNKIHLYKAGRLHTLHHPYGHINF